MSRYTQTCISPDVVDSFKQILSISWPRGGKSALLGAMGHGLGSGGGGLGGQLAGMH